MQFAKWVLTGALAVAFATPVEAQPRRTLEDPEGVLVEELVVVARVRSPAWWEVRDDDSVVYILAVPEQRLPPGITWDKSLLNERLKGANQVFMGTRSGLTARVWDIPALLKARKKVRTKKVAMEDTLSPDLRRRFVAARERLGKPAERYDDWQPFIAGMLLMGDAYGGKGWTTAGEDVVRAARRARVPLRNPPPQKAMPVIGAAIAGLNPRIQTECMEGALDDVEAGIAPQRRAAQAWARGDTPRALQAPRAFSRCLLAMNGGAQMWRNMMRDNATAIATALETPGHSIAIVNLRPLLAEDGIVQQLKARGLEVEGPGAE